MLLYEPNNIYSWVMFELDFLVCVLSCALFLSYLNRFLFPFLSLSLFCQYLFLTQSQALIDYQFILVRQWKKNPTCNMQQRLFSEGTVHLFFVPLCLNQHLYCEHDSYVTSAIHSNALQLFQTMKGSDTHDLSRAFRGRSLKTLLTVPGCLSPLFSRVLLLYSELCPL